MTLMSLGPENVRRVPDRGPPDDDIQAASPVEQRMLDSWQRQIAYCQKHRELLSKRDRLLVDDLAGREPTPGWIRYLNAVTAAIRRDPRCSRG
jgi:hypothetical protein